MTKKEKVIDGLTHCGVKSACMGCSYYKDADNGREMVICIKRLFRDALDLIQDTTVSAAEVAHAIGNADIPEGVPEEQFYKVVGSVMEALKALYEKDGGKA